MFPRAKKSRRALLRLVMPGKGTEAQRTGVCGAPRGLGRGVCAGRAVTRNFGWGPIRLPRPGQNKPAGERDGGVPPPPACRMNSQGGETTLRDRGGSCGGFRP